MTLQIEITDDDVAVIQGIMGRDFSDSERLDVLKTMCSCHVQACPGSGKTTLLVAKLAILARKIPSAHQGICVLSHTNAARAEIERSLGAYASSVFRYPHFIGTIQAFVDQFMAIPALIEKFGVHPWAIDDDIFARVAASHFVTLPYAARNFLDNRTQNKGAAVLGSLRHRFSNQECCLYQDGDEAEFWAGKQTVSGQAVASLKDKLTQEGCIAYHDAFAWANWYLTRYPDLPTVISHRFPFVFIDEMQDTDAFQWELLSRALSKSQLIQCFGDTNQAIYTARSSEAQPGWRPEAPLQVGSSHRLSQSIARLSQNVCATPQELTGNLKLPCCHHTVFLFAKDSTQKVLPAFAELLVAEGLTDGPFKAVGAVGKANPNTDHFTIMSYWPSFQRRRIPSGRMQYLRDHFDVAQRILTQTGDCGEAIDCLANGLLELLRWNGNRYDPTTKQPYTTGTLLGANRARSAGSLPSRFRNQLVDWCRDLTTGSKLDWGRCITQVQDVLAPLLPQGLNSEAKTFVSDPSTQTANTVAIRTTDNLFRHDVQERQIIVEVNTIHAVKGQNHQATLLLETYFYQHDLENLLPYLAGDRLKAPGKRLESRLPLAYVAMTRPTHLLCLAICRDHVTSTSQQKLVNFGWCLQEV
jgi:DNA helicase II / ATP-dependent DNA helicase PcrA